MNRETNTIIREGVESIINPFDMYAVRRPEDKGTAGRKGDRAEHGHPVSCGTAQDHNRPWSGRCRAAERQGFCRADTLATSYALSMGIMKIGNVDLVICGKQATDGDTAQVGPTAEKLGWPHTTYVRKIEEINENYIRCQRMTEDGYEVVEMPLPAVITVVKEINEPRLPSLKNMMRAKKAVVTVRTADDTGADKNRCGLKGSPTQVIETFVPVHDINSEMIEGDPEEAARKLADKLLSMQFPVGGC